ncbi:MAG: hypothetical protein KAV45_06055 [Calditrichia bacterium]|nr:hypothetical protein [Calditrichia bacterium]
MKNKLLFSSILIIFLLWMLSCSEEKNPVATGVNPVISKVKLQDKWSTQSSGFYKTEVWVNDPQGLGNLTGVYLTVHESSGGKEIFSDSLYDEGSYHYPEAGDVLAGDGVFSNRFQTADISESVDQAEYIFRFIAFDMQNHESQIWENLITFGPNSPPVIHQISAPDSLSFQNENTIFSITVSDSDGIEDIAQAYFESKSLNRGFTLYEQELYNDGDFENHGDLLAGDSIFSTRILPEFLAGKKGQYDLIFHVEDTNEEQNMAEAKHLIYIENFKSEFVAFDIPDVILIPPGSGEINRELITAEVSDPEGLADIDSVYFFSLKPDSSLANNGQPFIMVDNGLPYNPGGNLWIETGDETAGDGIYSLSIFADNTSLPGVYTFSFFIRDKAGNLTGPVKKTLQLTQ